MARFKKGINWVEVDAKLYTPIKQGVVILKETNNIKTFYNFLFSKKAKKIFKRFGYLI
jgi:molybdate transport system substrate-binding protein